MDIAAWLATSRLLQQPLGPVSSQPILDISDHFGYQGLMLLLALSPCCLPAGQFSLSLLRSLQAGTWAPSILGTQGSEI